MEHIKIAFGCSHTAGVGVLKVEAWPALLGAANYGKGGCSADYIARIFPDVINQTSPDIVYILWPDYSRFEYEDGDKFVQSLPTDSNRIYFMETATEEWLRDNFSKQVNYIIQLCETKNIKLVHMELYDLIPHIDHADKWPISKLGHHYAPVWHTWVADIFRKKEHEQA